MELSLAASYKRNEIVAPGAPKEKPVRNFHLELRVRSEKSQTASEGGRYMLRWALIFFVVALVAALFGFGGIALAAAGVAKILFYLFLILFLITLVGHLLRRT
jgi:uncharacterized membrane protein YtjA (UPF0391 family)